MTSPLAYGLAGGLQGFLQGKAQGLQFQVEDEIYRRRQAAQELKEQRLAQYRAELQLGTSRKAAQYEREDALAWAQSPEGQAARRIKQEDTEATSAADARGRLSETPPHVIGTGVGAAGSLEVVMRDSQGNIISKGVPGVTPRPTGKPPKTPQQQFNETINEKGGKTWDKLSDTFNEEGIEDGDFVKIAANVAQNRYRMFRLVYPDLESDEGVAKAAKALQSGRAPKMGDDGQPLPGELDKPTGPRWRDVFREETYMTTFRDLAHLDGSVDWVSKQAAEFMSRTQRPFKAAMDMITEQYGLDPQSRRQVEAFLQESNPGLMGGEVDLLKNQGIIDFLKG